MEEEPVGHHYCVEPVLQKRFRPNRHTEPAAPVWRSRLCALSVWLVADYHLQFYYADACFPLTLRAEQREV